MAATMKESVTAGPALSAEAAAVRTNRPAPMMAPTPRATRLLAVRVRFRSPWLARASRTSSDLRRVRSIVSVSLTERRVRYDAGIFAVVSRVDRPSGLSYWDFKWRVWKGIREAVREAS